MRRQVFFVMFSAVVGLCAASVAASPTVEAGAITATAPVTEQRVSPLSAGLRDEAAAMVILGTALIGLAAVVRRSA